MNSFGDSLEDAGFGNEIVGEPRIAKGLCVLGALNQRSRGHIAGKFSRLIKLNENTENVSLNFLTDTSERNEFSNDLTNIGPENGSIPKVNPAPGAPLATFVYGGIAADEAHPVLDLIKGPPKNKKCSTTTGDSIVYYTAPYIRYSTEALYGEIQTDVVVSNEVDLNAYYTNNNPLVPTRRDSFQNVFDLYANSKPLHTYNIWKMRYPSRFKTSTFDIENYIEYKKNYGPYINLESTPGLETAYDGPLIGQSIFASGAQVIVSSPRDFVFTERIFPISHDLLYSNYNTEDVVCYYSFIKADDNNLVTPFPRKVSMSGGANCGFQMHFTCSGIDPTVNAKNGLLAPTVLINWGDYQQDRAGVISRFQLIITSQGTELRYYNPNKKVFNIPTETGEATKADSRWVKIKLENGVSLSTETVDFSVYVHFAGPYMYIGFANDNLGENPTWHSLGPVDDESNDFSKMDLNISEEATIAVGVGYMTATFKYGPMTFKNYNRQNIKDITSLQDFEHLNYIDFTLVAPEGKEKYLDKDTVSKRFFNMAYTSRSAALNKDTNMSFAPDHRALADSQFSIFWREGPALVPSAADDPEDIQPLYYVKGTVRFNTTFEGPVFFEITNNITPDIQPEPPYIPLNINDSRRILGTATNGTLGDDGSSLIKQYKWGDISRFLTSWNVNYSSSDTSNSAYIGMTGTATFENMATDEMGRKILTVIDKNRTTITLGAGYTEGYPVRFAQGVITEVNTVRSSTGTVTTMNFEDVGTYLLRNNRAKDPYVFSGMKYRRITQSVLEILGLGDYYSQLPSSTNTAWSRALDLRAAVNGLPSSVINNAIMLNGKVEPLSVVQTVLSVMIEKNATPAFFWDCVDEIYRMEWRQSPQYVENLYFAGYNNTTNSYLPNAQTEQDAAYGLRRDWQHGVLVSDWAMTSSFGNLIYKLLLYSKDANGRFISYKHIAKNAMSAQAWNQLNNLENLRVEDIPSGYVGHEFVRLDYDDKAVFQDKVTLHKYGDAIVESIIGNPYDTISFRVHVTRPLLHWGRFILQTFVGDRAVETEPYYYKSITYSFSKDDNNIIADIKGEYAPPLKSIMGVHK